MMTLLIFSSVYFLFLGLFIGLCTIGGVMTRKLRCAMRGE